MIYFDASKPSPGTYATVWSIEQNDKGFVKGRITTSEKDSDGNFINSTWFPTFAKNLSEKALTLKSGDRILMDKFALKNPSVKKEDGKYVNYFNAYIYHFSTIEGNSTGSTTATGSGFPKPKAPIKPKEAEKIDEEPDGLPFDL
jgi:co-chaperonin GroES (HSP10)